MPESLNSQPAPADQPPDPAAAKAAAREARRRLFASRWPLHLWMGLSALPVALLMTDRPFLFYAWLFAAYAFSLILPAILKRLASGRGGYALPAEQTSVASGAWQDRLKAWLLFWLPLIASILLPSEPLFWVGLAAYFAGLFAWHALALRLWEPIFAAAAAAAGGIFALVTRATPLECMRMVAIVAAVIAVPWSISFLLRWRRWSRPLLRGGAKP